MSMMITLLIIQLIDFSRVVVFRPYLPQYTFLSDPRQSERGINSRLLLLHIHFYFKFVFNMVK